MHWVPLNALNERDSFSRFVRCRDLDRKKVKNTVVGVAKAHGKSAGKSATLKIAELQESNLARIYVGAKRRVESDERTVSDAKIPTAFHRRLLCDENIHDSRPTVQRLAAVV